jgi:hypothetical protein
VAVSIDSTIGVLDLRVVDPHGVSRHAEHAVVDVQIAHVHAALGIHHLARDLDRLPAPGDLSWAIDEDPAVIELATHRISRAGDAMIVHVQAGAILENDACQRPTIEIRRQNARQSLTNDGVARANLDRNGHAHRDPRRAEKQEAHSYG